ncbi:uncharacterized protein BDR25DRAFT_348589 [Lindgomyces ingoldianus]|uniref:Uncharacterized protein n=1 Tax=Lindgomyces ingoldianus TaxID=673940 RepID=A0ACB6RGJ8_9PLEO|nr:uncharacterized protein BDR25DRAFT_348589 [Lindgomyces ingoldianus]KAF2478336.1 hypothetical protein BDR25DRAFT_348589 [Lindgomyces ingoldianus]
MPRHKRQRPSWLPNWVPYKDGRILGLARQTNLAWISAILALSFFSMTVSYATEKSKFTSVKFVHSSRSNTILVLRVLSEITSVFLGATIYSTFEVVQWLLISRPDGIRFPQFLALQSSTSQLGLICLVFGRGLPANQWPMKPRVMSLIRLVAEVSIPVIAVLIMITHSRLLGNVNTYPAYIPIASTMQEYAFGMQPFNASVASQLGVMEDLLFNINYVTFLSNPLHSIDQSPHSDDCSRGIAVFSNHSCTRRVLMTQEYQMVDANLHLTKDQDSEVVLSKNQQIYELEYHDNIQVSDENLECNKIHSGPAYYNICTRNADDGWVQAALIACPADLVVIGKCVQDRSWESDAGYTTSLRPSFLNATVSYDRRIGSILDHKAESEPIPTYIDASDLLRAMTVILNTTIPSQVAADWNPILGPPSHFFGRLIAGHMYRISKVMENTPSARVKGVNALQSIIAMSLFYCQNGILAQTVLPFAPNANTTTTTTTTNARPNFHEGAFEGQDKTSLIALAETRYRVQVGRATLFAYVVLSGLALTICIIALVIGSICELIKFDAEPTLWPALDFWTQCRVEDKNGALVQAQKRADLAWTQGQDLFKELEGLKVTRRKRKTRDGMDWRVENDAPAHGFQF